MCGGLVGNHIRDHAAQDQLVVNIRRIADQSDGDGLACRFLFLDQRHGFFEIIHDGIHITDGMPAFGACRDPPRRSVPRLRSS